RIASCCRSGSRIADARRRSGLAPTGISGSEEHAVEALITRFGLLAVFLGTAVEGDLALILGGVAAHMGLMDPLLVGVAGTFGGLFGDAVWSLVGRSNADAFRQSRVYRRVGPTIERLVERFGAWQILLARPVYGTRVASMLFWGTQRLPPARFV